MRRSVLHVHVTDVKLRILKAMLPGSRSACYSYTCIFDVNKKGRRKFGRKFGS